MMDNIVDRLRETADWLRGLGFRVSAMENMEAAAEIERLREKCGLETDKASQVSGKAEAIGKMMEQNL